MQTQSRRNSRCPWSREDGIFAPLLPLSITRNVHNPRPSPFPRWRQTKPSWSSQTVLQLCPSPHDIATLFVCVFFRPPETAGRPSNNPTFGNLMTHISTSKLAINDERPCLRSSCKSHCLARFKYLMHTEFPIVTIMSSICSRSESDEYKPRPAVHPSRSSIAQNNLNWAIRRQHLTPAPVSFHIPRGTQTLWYHGSNKRKTHRGSGRSSLTLPSKLCTFLSFSDSRTRVTHLGAFLSPFEHSDPNRTCNFRWFATLHRQMSEHSHCGTRFDSTLNLVVSLEQQHCSNLQRIQIDTHRVVASRLCQASRLQRTRPFLSNSCPEKPCSTCDVCTWALSCSCYGCRPSSNPSTVTCRSPFCIFRHSDVPCLS